MALTDAERRIVRELARSAVEFGVVHGEPMPCAPDAYPERLRAPGATFVTLRDDGELLGCIGSLRPRRALVHDVVHNSYHAAFSDPRFPPVTVAQLERLQVHVSILSPLSPIAAASEAELLAALRPGVDGLVIEDGRAVATFLPAMWAHLPTPREFLDALRDKADLPRGYWSGTLRAYRYTVENA